MKSVSSDSALPPQPLLVDAARAAALAAEAVHLPSWDLGARQVWDLELLLNGAFSPLDGYLDRADHESVLTSMRLRSGALWPMPIPLDVSAAFADPLSASDRVALRHPEGMVLGILTVEEAWTPDREADAAAVFGTSDETHPGVRQLLHETHPVYLGGPVEGLELPAHHTFHHLRHTPRALREAFEQRGWTKIVAFQTRNPMHHAHVEMTRRAAAEIGGNLLLHPVVGRTSPGDVDYFTRVRGYEQVLSEYASGSALLSLLPLAMRMAGPREALWHTLIRRNYGATHFIVGRDHAGARDGDGRPFYDPDAARALVTAHADEAGIKIVPFEEMVYCEDLARHVPRSEVPAGGRVLSLSGTELRRRLRAGAEIPAWFSSPAVIETLRRRYPPREEQGFTVFFTGLSGAGKSTIAQILMAKLLERQPRPVTLLDGDIVRKNLSSELGFSAEHRDLNIRRIGFVAGEITKNRGVAICAPIAPYRHTRREVRTEIEQYGGFILVHVATPLEICEQRDRKGLYAKARQGLITGFTGIDDPYEAPENADVVIDTSAGTAEQAAAAVLDHLVASGYLDTSGKPEAARSP